MKTRIRPECRICMSYEHEMVPIFLKTKATPIYKMISTITSLNIQPDDLPKTICKMCLKQVRRSYAFRQFIIDADTEYRTILTSAKTKNKDIVYTSLRASTQGEDCSSQEEHNISENIDNTKKYFIIESVESLSNIPSLDDGDGIKIEVDINNDDMIATESNKMEYNTKVIDPSQTTNESIKQISESEYQDCSTLQKEGDITNIPDIEDDHEIKIEMDIIDDYEINATESNKVEYNTKVIDPSQKSNESIKQIFESEYQEYSILQKEGEITNIHDIQDDCEIKIEMDIIDDYETNATESNKMEYNTKVIDQSQKTNESIKQIFESEYQEYTILQKEGEITNIPDIEDDCEIKIEMDIIDDYETNATESNKMKYNTKVIDQSQKTNESIKQISESEYQDCSTFQKEGEICGDDYENNAPESNKMEYNAKVIAPSHKANESIKHISEPETLEPDDDDDDGLKSLDLHLSDDSMDDDDLQSVKMKRKYDLSELKLKGDHPCPICKEKFKFRAHLESHGLHKHQSCKILKCPKCNMLFQHIFCMKIHMQSHLSGSVCKDDDLVRQFRCIICPKSYVHLRSLKFHVLRSHK